jgi:hypothetical protein
MAANLKFTLKRNNGTDYDELYPKTVIAQVNGLQTALDNKVDDSEKGAANGVATLGSDSKLTASQVPTWLMSGGNYYAGSYASGTSNLSTFITTLTTGLASGEDIKNRYGWFYQATVATTLSFANGTPANTNYVVSPGDEGDATSSISLEAGDLVVFTSYSFSSPTATYTFSVINNTYNTAGYGVLGIAQALQSSSLQDWDASGASYYLAPEDVFGFLVGGDQNGATTDGIAMSGHTHSNYQPVDADLTAIAGLAVTDGNFIVGNGTTWVAESGSTARASLGLAINTDVQAYDAGLASIAGLNPVADRYLYTTGTDTFAAGTITSFGRSILDDADAAAVRTTIGATDTLTAAEESAIANGSANGDMKIWNSTSSLWVNSAPGTVRTNLSLVVGTNVQAWDADLDAIAALAGTSGFLKKTAANTWTLDTNTYQASSATLTAIAGLAVTDGNIIVGNGSTWVAESGATARTSLGVYSTTEVDAFFTNRPEIFYNTTTGAGSADLIIADVVAA